MIVWEDLLKTALLGTDRQRAPVNAGGATPAAIASTLSLLPQARPDAALLAAAAVVSTSLRAGRIAPVDASIRQHPPCDPDEAPAPGVRAEQQLRRTLVGDHRDLLPEWLAACAAASRRVPATSLPALREVARLHTEYRDALLPVLGKRGRWLAAQNPDWSYAAGAAGAASDTGDADALWQTGDRAARLSLLKSLRHSNPSCARALVESTWSREPADDRARFLGAMETGLSLSDEPLLEAALDDRSKEVRRTAAALLARLPNSQLVRRMTERARPLLAWKPGKKPKVEVTLPPAPDKAAERDGVEPKPSQTRFGRKQWWMWQTLAAVPPSIWSKQWGAGPAGIIAAVGKNDFENMLVTGWAQAAARHGDAAWAEAILSTEAATVVEWAGQELAGQLVALLPDARRDALLLDQLAADARHERGGEDSAALVMLQSHAGPWSRNLSRAVVERVRDIIRRPPLTDWVGSTLLREAATRVPPDMLDELTAGWPENVKTWDQWKRMVDEFLSTVQFRRDMLEEIRR